MGMNRVDFSKPITFQVYEVDNNREYHTFVDSLKFEKEVFKSLFLHTPVRNFIVDTCEMQSFCEDMEGNTLLTAFCSVQKAIEFFASIKSEVESHKMLLLIEKIEAFITKQDLDGEIMIHFHKLNI